MCGFYIAYSMHALCRHTLPDSLEHHPIETQIYKFSSKYKPSPSKELRRGRKLHFNSGERYYTGDRENISEKMQFKEFSCFCCVALRLALLIVYVHMLKSEMKCKKERTIIKPMKAQSHTYTLIQIKDC